MAINTKVEQFIGLTKKYFGIYFGVAISIVLFIQFFQPFTITTFDFENKLLIISGFGIIALISFLFSQMLFQKQLLKAEWDIGGNSIFLPLYFFIQVTFTSLAFIFYIRYVGQTNVTFYTAVKVILICITLPVTIYLKIRLSLYQERIKNLIMDLRALNEKQKHFSEKNEHDSIELISDNESDNLRLQVSDIIYAKSADNYVEIGYYDVGEVKKKMVRNTLRNIEKQLMEFNNFIRTHRTSIVNIQYIQKLNKSFNTYWLSLDSTNETISVSRQYLMSVKEVV